MMSRFSYDDNEQDLDSKPHNYSETDYPRTDGTGYGSRYHSATAQYGFQNNTKPTNPKDAIGSAKIPTHVVPQGVLLELGAAMLEGACKYGSHNYRAAGVRASVYKSAADRHMTLFWDFGEDIDPDSGISNITKAIAGLVVLRDSMMMGNWLDDRPPPLPRHVYDEIQAAVTAILAKYPHPKAPVTAKEVNLDTGVPGQASVDESVAEEGDGDEFKAAVKVFKGKFYEEDQPTNVLYRGSPWGEEAMATRQGDTLSKARADYLRKTKN